MKPSLPPHWTEALARLDYAFQPIALYASGAAYGFEALLRGWDSAGFASIAAVFDRAFAEGTLCGLDLALREKAFRKFAAAELGAAKVFYNVDTRLLQMPDYAPDNTIQAVEEAGLAPSRVVFELTELHEPDSRTVFDRAISAYRSQGFRIALDDFGSGYAGLKMLHRAEPDIVKVDRYFVSGTAEEPRKAAFLEKIAGMAHLMGISVIAEGVENEQELRLCYQAGCDMVQGFHIARPNLDIAALSISYPAAAVASKEDRRSSTSAGKVGAESVVPTEPVGLHSDLSMVLNRFRKDPSASIIPVVDADGEPVGIYRERDFRRYVYSPYGISLLEHIATDFGASAFLVRAPVAPLGTDLARIVELYGVSTDGGGVVLTEGGHYAGVLPAEKLLALVAERELAEARDQSPLTHLPGNLRVAEVCAQLLADTGRGIAFAYFDFDNFKPFNDRYGFRNGDRVIMLFADILKSTIRRPPGFIGHLGGDDFFVSLDVAKEEDLSPLFEAAERFGREAASFYSPADREQGWILGVDRDGKKRQMPLLSVSVAIVVLEPGVSLDAEGLSEVLAELKREAKLSPDRRAIRVFSKAQDRESDAALPIALPSPSVRRDEASPSLCGPATPIFTPSLIGSV